MPFALSIESAVLGQLLKKMAPVTPTEYDLRMSGILFRGGKLTVVGCEGIALGVVTIDLEVPEGETILSVNTCEMLRAMIRGNPGTVTIAVGDRVVATCGCRQFTTPLAGKNFPTVWPSMLFTDPTLRADFQSHQALDAISRTTTGESIAVTLQLERGSLTFLSDNGREEIGVDYDGEPFQTAFKPRALSGIIRALDGSRVEWLGKGPFHHAIFRSVGSTAEQYVLMPLRPNAA